MIACFNLAYFRVLINKAKLYPIGLFYIIGTKKLVFD